MTNFGLISYLSPLLQRAGASPKPTNRLFRLLCQPSLPLLPIYISRDGTKNEKVAILDNGGCGLKKNERKKIRSSSMIRFEKIRSNSSPLRESIRYVTFQHGSRTEAKQRMMIRFQSAVDWFRFGNDNSPSLELVAILGDFTPLRQRSGF